MSYSKIKKHLEETYFENENDIHLYLVGCKYLDFLLCKVSNFQFKDIKFYERYQQRFSDLVIQELNISDTKHLRQCMGSLVKSDNYKLLRQISDELTQILKKEARQDSLSRTKSFQSSSDEKSENQRINVQFHGSARSSFFEKNKSRDSISISSIQNNKNTEKSYTHILYQLQEQSQWKSAEQSQIAKFNKNGKKFMCVQQYLRGLDSYQTQLNLVVQKLKLKVDTWSQSMKGSTSIQQLKVYIPDLLSKKKAAFVTGQGKGSNKKKARQEAAMQILRKIYETYPQIFEQARIIKNQVKREY